MPVMEDQHPHLEYAYDAIGNITRKTDFADVYGYGSAASSGAVGGSSQVCGPNALSTAMSTAANISRSYKCDNNGNPGRRNDVGCDQRVLALYGSMVQTCRRRSTTPIRTIRPASAVMLDFAYGPGNARYRRTERGSGNAVVNYYGADGYEATSSVESDCASDRARSRRLHPRRDADRERYDSSSIEVGYQLRDRLGSTVAIADRWGHFNGTDESAPFYYGRRIDTPLLRRVRRADLCRLRKRPQSRAEGVGSGAHELARLHRPRTPRRRAPDPHERAHVRLSQRAVPQCGSVDSGSDEQPEP